MDNNKAILSFDEMIQYLGIGRTKGYQLCAIDGFPVIRVGRKYLIPVDGLREWLKANQGKKVAEA